MAAPPRRHEEEAAVDPSRPPPTPRSPTPSLGAEVSNQAIGRAVRGGTGLPRAILRAVGGEFGGALARAAVERAAPPGAGGALAATTGVRIVVAPGVDLQSAHGARVLAHEAAHVIQQTTPAAQGDGTPSVTDAEQRADDFADDVLAGRSPAHPGRAGGKGVQFLIDLPGGTSNDIDVDVYRPETLTDAERLSGIRQILDEPTVSAMTPWANRGMSHTTKVHLLSGLWHAFGERTPDVGRAHGALWRRSLDLGAPLWDLPVFTDVRAAFKADVKELARRHMDGNLAAVREELAALGFRGSLASHGFAPDEPQRRMAELREQAEPISQLLTQRAQLRTIVVGYRPSLLPLVNVEATFEPGAPPRFPPTGREDPPLPAHSDVQRRWDEATAVLAQLTTVSPALHGMAHHEPERLDTLISGDDITAREAVRATLMTLLDTINRTKEMVRTDDLDYRDLAPLHAQLFFGQEQTGGAYDWTDPWTRAIARDVLMDHKWNEFWIQIGLAALSAAAFMFGPLGGAAFRAVAFGVGSGAGILQAGMSWERYIDLATAEQAEARTGSGVVAQGAADTALVGAILDTLFAFFDVVPPVWKGVAGLRAGRQLRAAGQAAAVGADLGRLAMLRADEITGVVQRGVNEFGIAGAARRAGRTPVQLLGVVDPRAPVAALLREHVERSRMGLRGSTALGDMSETAATAAIRQGDPSVIMAAIAEEGIPATIRRAGGWKRLTGNLDDSMFVAHHLERWRNRVFQDLQQFLDGNIKATGSRGSIRNDLDMSLTGPTANADRLRAREFLAGRLGAPADEIPNLLHGDLFVDPRRIHLYDMIEDPQIRAEVAADVAVAERELMWGYALHRAAGNPELEEVVRQQMMAAGVTPAVHRPVGPNELVARAKRADALHAEFLRRQDAGDVEGMAAAAREAAVNQTIINIAEREGYFSGAGVRRRVSEKDAFTPPGAVAVSDPELANAMLDQSIKLNDALADLTDALATRTAAEVSKALRSLGKYGNRLAETAALLDPRALPVSVGDAMWEQLIDEWASLKAAIDERAVILSPGYHGIPSPQAFATDLPVAVRALIIKMERALERTHRVHVGLIGELRARDVFRTSAEARKLLDAVQRGYGPTVHLAAVLQEVIEHVIGQQASELDTHRFE